MLANSEIIRIVGERAQKYSVDLLIIDPVMIAKGGDALLKPDANDALVSELLPLAYVITPNHHEAQLLASIEIKDLEDARSAAKQIHSMGPKNVIIKGGHLPGITEAIDLLYDGKIFTEFSTPRIDTKNTHGTGCTFASALAAELAKGKVVKKAVHIAKAYLTTAIQKAKYLKIGHGYGPTDHSQGLEVKVNLDLVKVREF
jgi:hydroxymethylpyrimidine/phosphomethylpyrimidine kinase